MCRDPTNRSGSSGRSLAAARPPVPTWRPAVPSRTCHTLLVPSSHVPAQRSSYFPFKRNFPSPRETTTCQPLTRCRPMRTPQPMLVVLAPQEQRACGEGIPSRAGRFFFFLESKQNFHVVFHFSVEPSLNRPTPAFQTNTAPPTPGPTVAPQGP